MFGINFPSEILVAEPQNVNEVNSESANYTSIATRIENQSNVNVNHH